jgi:hexosaminidase
MAEQDCFRASLLTNEYPEAELQINCTRNGKIEINEDESYRLTVTSNRIAIDAATDLGALHGLETLLQLLQNNSTSITFQLLKYQMHHVLLGED